MSRFFAFGCSFTVNSSRPTWADIIGQQFDYYENWARGGSGNQYIFNSLVECNQRNKFTPDDTVMIMWSSVTREDRYVKDYGGHSVYRGWFGNGNIFSQTVYPQDWVKQFACERGYLIRDLATISAATDLLKFWGVHYKQMSMMPFTRHENDYNKPIDNADVIALYQPTLDQILPSVYEVIFNNQNWQDRYSDFCIVDRVGNINIRDSHPDPREALEYVEKVLPELPIKQETRDWIMNFKLGDVINLTYPGRL